MLGADIGYTLERLPTAQCQWSHGGIKSVLRRDRYSHAKQVAVECVASVISHNIDQAFPINVEKPVKCLQRRYAFVSLNNSVIVTMR